MFLRAALILFFISQLYLCLSIDTITQHRPIKDGDVITSKEGNFTLGFFSPGKSTKRYVGVWYSKILVQSLESIVWVANRENPVNDSSGVLSIGKDGNLVLSAQNITLWSTNATFSNSKTQHAQLLDLGNLVLVSDGGKTRTWQSFDYPTHTFLPGMAIGLDKKSGFNRFLTSWRSNDDPGVGNYSFKVEPNGSPQYFLYMDSTPIWRTGPWLSEKWSGIAEMSRTFMFNDIFNVTSEEVTWVFYDRNPSTISTCFLDGVLGVIRRSTWHESTKQWTEFWTAPRGGCDVYGKCGPYAECDPNGWSQFECSCFPGYEPKSPQDWSVRDGRDGCIRKEENISVCGNGEGFLKLVHVKVPDSVKARVNMDLRTLQECEKDCLKNCSCMGYASADGAVEDVGQGGGCLGYYGDLIDTMEYTSGGNDIYYRVDRAVLAKHLEKSKRHKMMVNVLVVSAALAVIGLTSLAYRLYLKKKKERENQREILGWATGFEENDTNSDITLFDRNAIVTATNNFSFFNKLGEGGFGSVYKGRFANGQEIAVKRLGKNSKQGMQEFKNEVLLISKLQHRNLVKTLGCCVQGDEMMLIYEFLANKSLDKFIFDAEKKSLLDWKKRYEIILGIARGTMYLHQDSRLRIIHRDLKASNVLLDSAMVPKISDFGMARIFGGDQDAANTNRVVGTYGYMAPEYAMEGLFSVKSDVFSFGVLMLEIISGRKSVAFYYDNASVNLIGQVWQLWKEGHALNIVDETMAAEGQNDEDISRCIQVGLLCVQENAVDRPSMSTVVFMLDNKTELPEPEQPAFVTRKSPTAGTGHDPSSSSTGKFSANDVSLTAVEPR